LPIVSVAHLENYSTRDHQTLRALPPQKTKSPEARMLQASGPLWRLSVLLDQNDNQRIQRKGLNQRHADNESDSDRPAGSWIPRSAFASRGGRPALTEPATRRRYAQCKRGREIYPVNVPASGRLGLRERHGRKGQGNHNRK
jgi:hypothetical protein